MNLIISYKMLLISFIFVVYALDPGTLNGYYTSAEVNSTLYSLASNSIYSSITENKEVTILHYGIPNNNKQAKILIFGGFHAGLPMTTYEVVNTIGKFIQKQNIYNDIRNNLLTDYIPIINIKAYQKMETNWDGKTFKIYMTDLIEPDSKCDLQKDDYGTNPDHNFDFMFGSYNDKCSPDYNGPKPLSSLVTQVVDFTSYDYVINFQTKGKGYYRPYATDQKTMQNSCHKYYYKNIGASSALSSTGPSTGTLMDFLYDAGILSFQIGVSNDKSPNDDDFNADFEMIYNTLKTTFGQPEIDYLSSNYSDGSKYEYDDLVDFQFVVHNKSPYKIQIQINDEIDVDSNYVRLFYDTYMFDNSSDDGYFSHYSTNGTNNNFSIDPCSDLTIHYTYGVDNMANATFLYALTVSSVNDSFYFETAILRDSVSVVIPDATDDFTARVVVGVCLGIVMVLVFFSICYFVLCKRKLGLLS